MSDLISLTVPPRPVAVTRIALGFATLLVALEGAVILLHIAEGRMAVPVPGPWLGADDLGIAPLLLSAVAGVGLVVGIRPGWCAALIVVTESLVLLADQQLYSNHRILLLLVCAGMVFARADAALAPGASSRPDAVPWWPQLLMLAAVSSCYLFAGLSKINPEWWSGSQLDGLRWIELSGTQLHVLAAATILTEIAISIGLWLPRVRLAAIVLGLGLHTSIALVMPAPFVFVGFALLCVSVYPLALTRPALAVETAPT